MLKKSAAFWVSLSLLALSCQTPKAKTSKKKFFSMWEVDRYPDIYAQFPPEVRKKLMLKENLQQVEREIDPKTGKKKFVLATDKYFYDGESSEAFFQCMKKELGVSHYISTWNYNLPNGINSGRHMTNALKAGMTVDVYYAWNTYNGQSRPINGLSEEAVAIFLERMEPYKDVINRVWIDIEQPAVEYNESGEPVTGRDTDKFIYNNFYTKVCKEHDPANPYHCGYYTNFWGVKNAQMPPAESRITPVEKLPVWFAYYDYQIPDLMQSIPELYADMNGDSHDLFVPPTIQDFYGKIYPEAVQFANLSLWCKQGDYDAESLDFSVLDGKLVNKEPIEQDIPQPIDILDKPVSIHGPEQGCNTRNTCTSETSFCSTNAFTEWQCKSCIGMPNGVSDRCVISDYEVRDNELINSCVDLMWASTAQTHDQLKTFIRSGDRPGQRVSRAMIGEDGKIEACPAGCYWFADKPVCKS